MVRRYLEAEGFGVVEATHGDEALAAVAASGPDLILLDVSMPGRDGFDTLQAFRRTTSVPVIMLTARAEEIDRVIGLSVGADDYVTKPFSPRELVARIRAVLRRSAPAGAAETERPLTFDGLIVDPLRREVVVDGKPVDFSTLEFDLLTALASSPGWVLSRAQLLEKVWGWDYYGVDRVVDVHIANIRKQLHDDPDSPRFIGTVRGVGYKFVGTPT